jgi:hypothetical protein
MHCPGCGDQTLFEVDDLAGGRSAHCRQCKGRWCGIDEAVALGALVDPAPSLSVVSIAVCPACERRSLSPVLSSEAVAMRPLQCTACRRIWIPARAAKQEATSDPDSGPATNAGEPPAPAILKADVLRASIAPPALALLLLVTVNAPGLSFFIHTLLRMPAHELGHAAAGWLSGHVSIPLPFFTLNLGAAWISVPLAVSAIAGMAWWGSRHRLPFWLALAALAAFLGLKHGMFASAEARASWVSFSGCGGEFVLGAVFAMTYWHRVFLRPEWHRWRMLFALVGLAVYLQALTMWWGVAAGRQPFPYGSALGMEGDMDALVAAGATEAEITARYLRLAGVCGLAMLAQWAWSARQAHRRWRAGLSRSTGHR